MWRIASVLILTALFGIIVLQVAALPPSVPVQVAAVSSTGQAENAEANSHESMLIGVGTCANSGCHGGPDKSDDPNQLASSYASTVWFEKDPHARAFGVLLSDRSQDIVKQLTAHAEDAAAVDTGNPKSESYQAFLKQRCTECHATAKGTLTKPNDKPPRDYTFTDGVTCESCHGEAEKWLEPHTLKDWEERTEDQKRDDFGFIETGNVTARIQMCVKCHVGGPGAEVNHELISAGHPRLNFEFHYYMNRLTRLARHWDEKNLNETPAESWAAGQRASSNQALALLETRASKPVWHEFSEYACYSCHHDLDVNVPGRKSTGRPVWGSWYFAKFAHDVTKLEDLQQATEFGSTQTNIADLINQVKQLPSTLRTGASDRETLTEAVRRGPQRINWDELAQWYLAIWALRDELGIQDHKKLDTALEQLRHILTAPFGNDVTEFEDFATVKQAIDEAISELTSE